MKTIHTKVISWNLPKRNQAAVFNNSGKFQSWETSVTAQAVGSLVFKGLGTSKKLLIQSFPNPLFLFVFCSLYLPSIAMSQGFWIFSAPEINYIALCICINALLLICNSSKLHAATSSFGPLKWLPFPRSACNSEADTLWKSFLSGLLSFTCNRCHINPCLWFRKFYFWFMICFRSHNSDLSN